MEAIKRQASAFLVWWREKPEGNSILVFTLALGLFAVITLVIKALVG